MSSTLVYLKTLIPVIPYQTWPKLTLKHKPTPGSKDETSLSNALKYSTYMYGEWSLLFVSMNSTTSSMLV